MNSTEVICKDIKPLVVLTHVPHQVTISPGPTPNQYVISVLPNIWYPDAFHCFFSPWELVSFFTINDSFLRFFFSVKHPPLLDSLKNKLTYISINVINVLKTLLKRIFLIIKPLQFSLQTFFNHSLYSDINFLDLVSVWHSTWYMLVSVDI